MIITAESAKHLYNTGYYKCDDQIFYSKIQACIYSSSVKKPITWINDQQQHWKKLTKDVKVEQ